MRSWAANDAVPTGSQVGARLGTASKAPRSCRMPEPRLIRTNAVENLAIRADNSVLVSKMLEKEVWYVPPVGGNLPVEPTCILTYDQPTLAIVEVEPDVFYLATSNVYTTHESYLAGAVRHLPPVDRCARSCRPRSPRAAVLWRRPNNRR